jgi:hypothetical protein
MGDNIKMDPKEILSGNVDCIPVTQVTNWWLPLVNIFQPSGSVNSKVHTGNVFIIVLTYNISYIIGSYIYNIFLTHANFQMPSFSVS